MVLFALFMGLSMTMWDHAPLYGAEVEIPSSFNPVGSGARALGMGGAFIAVADDATAASWNPGGLTQLKKPECSVVGAFYHRGEDLTFGTNPEADGSHSISDSNINYLSASYPFEAFDRNMIVSLSYQHLYDFNREWGFTLKQDTDLQVSDDNWEYRQSGSLTALGFSYCVRVIPQLSVGFTLNFWDDDLTHNNWEENYRMVGNGTIFEDRFTERYSKTDERSIQGVNYNLGLLWRINYKWTIGAVFKAPFKADVEHKIYRNSVMQIQLSDEGRTDESSDIESDIKDEELEMPMSYGIGVVYNVSDNLSVSGDIYRTEWSGCIYKNADGKETSPITGGSASDVEPTHQIRIGGEYRFINEEKGYLIPVRAGIFYDPAPAADGSSDDFYGMSLGIGFSKNDWLSLDIAYQYRYADDIGDHLMKGFQFSQDVDEHIVYLSMIWYKF